MWKYYALLSAFFAALTTIFAKLGGAGLILAGTLVLLVKYPSWEARIRASRAGFFHGKIHFKEKKSRDGITE